MTRILIRKDCFRKGYYSVHKTEKGYDKVLDYFKKKSDAIAFRKFYKQGKMKGRYP